jgi:hypothetical protein
MHTMKILAGGLALLSIAVFAGRQLSGTQGMSTATLVFLPIWFAGAGINTYCPARMTPVITLSLGRPLSSTHRC